MAYLFRYYAGIYDQFMRRFKLDSNQVLLQSMGDIQGKKVLDIGGGTGSLADKLQRRGAEVTLIDTSYEMTEQARKKNDKLIIFVSTLEDLEGVLKRDYFDTVILRDTLHHIKKADDVIALSQHYLKENGELLIWEFNAKAVIAKIIWCFELLCFEKCHRFSEDKLKHLCKPYFKEEEFRFEGRFEMFYKGKKRGNYENT